MHFDFAALLVILTALTGGIWALDSLVFARRRVALAAGGPAASDRIPRVKQPALVEYSRSFFPVILIVLLIRSFLAEPFRIPSSSMLPTLLVGDLILVNKFAYGIRLPVLDTKVLEIGSPQRGDVIVFRYPEDPSLDYIKRVVGVPGDVIEYRDRTLLLNGETVMRDMIGPYQESGGRTVGRPQRGIERLPGHEHEILITPGRHNSAPRDRWVVGEGEYFVLGDNRDNSRDSRFWGLVPDENLVGKAFFIWMHLSPSGLNRIGTVID